jgi:hypothetical protein
MISSQSGMLAGALILLLGGCVARQAAPALVGIPIAATFYLCTPSDGDTDTAAARSVEIDPGAAADEIILRFGSGHAQRLADVDGSSDRLFANASYAWRLAAAGPILTEVFAFQTYHCAPR